MKVGFNAAYMEYLANAYLVPFGIRLLLAIIVFYVGRIVVRGIVKMVNKMTTGRIDDALRKFLCSVLQALLMAVVIIAALERLGVQTTAAVAILGAAGLAIGLSLQGTLGNFAAGVMLIIFKPYKIGDVISVAGNVGAVQEIAVFNTIILTPDNRKVIIPNGQIIGGPIENLTAMPQRRIDMTFGIGYEDDMKKAKALMEEVMNADERILKDPGYTVAVGELADSSVNFVVRPWVKPEHYWDVMFSLNEKIKERFDAEGISIPFPQTDVHLHKVA